VFQELTAGASSDIDRATRIARAMVVEYGMSALGPIHFGPQYEMSNYSRSWMEPSKISDQMQEKVDAAVQALITTAQQQAEHLLTKHRALLDTVSAKLLELETLDAEQFAQIVGEKVIRGKG
jgi:cell division protease FtsH